MSDLASRLERTQWDFFWLPPGTHVVDRPELQLVSASSPNPTLNMVVRTRAAPDRIPALVAEAEEAFRGRRARWQVPDTFDRAPLEGTLAAAGWDPGDRHHARVSSVEDWRRGAPLDTRPIDTRARLLDAIAVADAAFGRTSAPTEEALDGDLRQCVSGARVHRFVAYDADRPVATGGLTAFFDLGVGLLWGGGTVPAARGRGAYLSVLAARVDRARALGLRWVALYAKVDTSDPIVSRLGFARHGDMTFWEKDVA